MKLEVMTTNDTAPATSATLAKENSDPRKLICGCVMVGRVVVLLCHECNEDYYFQRRLNTLRREKPKDPWLTEREKRIQAYAQIEENRNAKTKILSMPQKEAGQQAAAIA